MEQPPAGGGLDFDYVDPSKPFLYNQPALSYVVNGPLSALKIPTQIVYPNGRISLGCAPTRSPWSEDADHGASEESDEARLNRLRQSAVVVCASVDPSNATFDAHVNRLTIAFLVCIAFQMMWIVVILSGYPIETRACHHTTGGSLVPFDPNQQFGSETSGTVFQRSVYLGEVIFHLFPSMQETKLLAPKRRNSCRNLVPYTVAIACL